MRAVIIEDEQDAVQLLSGIIESYIPDLEIVGHSDRKASSIALLSRDDIDIAFLDIQLFDCTAFDILEEVDISNLNIIFTTAYDQYAIKAFDYFAVGYVLKPYAPDEIVKVVQRITSTSRTTLDYQQILQHIESHYTDKILTLPTNEGLERVKTSEIIKIEAQRAYSTIYLKDNRKITISKPLAYLETLTDTSQFVRPHLSYLVNLSAVVKYDKRDGDQLKMIDGSLVPVSRRRKTEILSLL